MLEWVICVILGQNQGFVFYSLLKKEFMEEIIVFLWYIQAVNCWNRFVFQRALSFIETILLHVFFKKGKTLFKAGPCIFLLTPSPRHYDKRGNRKFSAIIFFSQITFSRCQGPHAEACNYCAEFTCVSAWVCVSAEGSGRAAFNTQMPVIP